MNAGWRACLRNCSGRGRPLQVEKKEHQAIFPDRLCASFRNNTGSASHSGSTLRCSLNTPRKATGPTQQFRKPPKRKFSPGGLSPSNPPLIAPDISILRRSLSRNSNPAARPRGMRKGEKPSSNSAPLGGFWQYRRGGPRRLRVKSLTANSANLPTDAPVSKDWRFALSPAMIAGTVLV